MGVPGSRPARSVLPGPRSGGTSPRRSLSSQLPQPVMSSKHIQPDSKAKRMVLLVSRGMSCQGGEEDNEHMAEQGQLPMRLLQRGLLV